MRESKGVLLVTGGSRGIGAQTAILAAKRGYNVCVNYLKNESAAKSVVEKINKEGGKAFTFQADVTVEGEVKNLFREIDNHYGPITALVNNAGTLELQSRFESIELDRMERIFKSNFISCFLCTKEAIKRMSTKTGGKGGAIVNVSSLASRTGSPGEYIDYAVSKAAMDTFTIGLSKEVAEEGIRINAVRPGFIYTDIHASGGEPGRVDRVKDFVPMKRGGTPEEVAHAILWLLSDEASFSTGIFVDVTGGR